MLQKTGVSPPKECTCMRPMPRRNAEAICAGCNGKIPEGKRSKIEQKPWVSPVKTPTRKTDT